MMSAHRIATEGERLLVQWNGRCTTVLLVQADRTASLITEGDPEEVRDLLDVLASSYPSLPHDVRPGALSARQSLCKPLD